MSSSSQSAGEQRQPASGAEPTFRLRDAERAVVAQGVRAEVEPGAIDSFAERVCTFFAAHADGPRVIVGALPFDRSQADYLFQPETLVRVEGQVETLPAAAAVLEAPRCVIRPEPAPSAYRDAVAACLELIKRSAADVEPLTKVVLSRSLSLSSSHAFDAAGLLRALGQDRSVTVFSTLLPGERSGPQPLLVGATPELLVSKRGANVISHPLAGSARRYSDAAADRRSAAALESSEKDRREHQAVVDAVFDALSPYCRELAAPKGTTLRPTASMWHLGTRIVGTLKDSETPVTELAAVLHPTPAVCGLPRRRAAEVIGELEGYDRGFYAGAVGWTDEQGDGEWYVSIRSARIAGAQATLYAGAGIVAGSDPVAETDETSAKFVALLSALGIDEQGRPLRERAA
ncbi:isochorismate synthase [Borborobacter arsenicus]|uniref:isochorismate synthase n=1 Tax=Borborobacter arsenicus TaxID=1851146 RepID=UPI0014055943|nr:isochorismate synthase [Pseudaminobacter arsenicus]